MSLKLNLIAALVIGSSTAIAGCEAPPSNQADPGSNLASMAEDLREEFDLPGLIIGFQHGDHPAHVSVAGQTRRDDGALLWAAAPMHMGSVSKPLSATVIADLISDGHLDWNTNLFDVFSELKDEARVEYQDVTVWDLLTHEARFPAYADDADIAAAPQFGGAPRKARSDLLAWVITQPPQIPPEDEEPYSNAGYAVLAAVAERVMDEEFEAIVQERLFDRLGLASAGFGWPALKDQSAPWGHRFADGEFQPHPPDDEYQLGAAFAAAGDMHMSVPDLLKVAEAHRTALLGEDGPYDADDVKRLHQTETGYGGGWYVRPTGHYHTGSAETFFAMILVSPARNTVIGLATNGSNPDREFSIAGKVMGRVYRAYGVLEMNDHDGVAVTASE